MCVSVNTDDLEFCEGPHSEAGFSSELFFTKTGSILTFPKKASDTLSTAETTAATALIPNFSAIPSALKKRTLTTSIIFKTGMKFAKFPSLVDSGSLSGALVKEGSTSKKNEYTFECENTTLNSAILDDITTGVLAFKSTEGGVMVLGSPEYPAKKIKQEEKWDKASSGERMISVTFYCAKPYYDYFGLIQLTPAP